MKDYNNDANINSNGKDKDYDCFNNKIDESHQIKGNKKIIKEDNFKNTYNIILFFV